METNGLANIHALLYMGEIDNTISPEMIEKIKKELVLLEKYMIMMHDHAKSLNESVNYYQMENRPLQFVPWHEIRENPDKYKGIGE